MIQYVKMQKVKKRKKRTIKSRTPYGDAYQKAIKKITQMPVSIREKFIKDKNAIIHLDPEKKSS